MTKLIGYKGVFVCAFFCAVLLLVGFIAGWLVHEHLFVPEHAALEQFTRLSDRVCFPDVSRSERVIESLPQASASGQSELWWFKCHLEEGRFDDALTLYQAHERRGSELLPKLRDRLVQKVSLWQQNGDLDTCVNALERFTQYYYQDTGLLKMQINALEENNELARAIEVCILVSPLATRQAEVNYYRDSRHRLARRLFHHHYPSGSVSDQLALFQKLAYIEPDYAFYRYALALMYLSLGDTDNAIRELEVLQLDQEFGQKSSVLLADLKPVMPEEPEAHTLGMISLRAVGQHLVAPVKVGDKGHARLLIDTGASLTTMPSQLLQELKRKKQAARVGYVELRTAGGPRFSPLYSIKSFQIGEYLLKNLEVAELDMAVGEKADGLLGMNVLSRFRFQIDQERPALILIPR